MPPRDDDREPRVFVSHAWDDELLAKRFVADVERHGPELFIDSRDIPPGVNVVAAINSALDESDYFVLLWSASARTREWITREWSAALTREVREQRAFLFVVRLDETDPPVLLAQDRYLNAFGGNWDSAVTDLVEAWRRDRALGEPVLPAPFPPASEVTWGDRRVVVLHIYNQTWSSVHLVTAPVNCTASELRDRVRVMLALPDSVSALNGRVGMRFSYRLTLNGKYMQDNDTLAALGVTAYTVVNLEIWKSEFGPEGDSEAVVYRDGAATGLRAPMVAKLIGDAFGHLMPRRSRR